MKVGDLVRLSEAALAGGYDNDPDSAEVVGLIVALLPRNEAQVYWGSDIGLHTEYCSDIELVDQYKPNIDVKINNMQRRLNEGQRFVEKLE